MTPPSVPPAPLSRWAWVTLTLITVALLSVSAPINSVFYGVPAAISLVLAVLHCGSVLAAAIWPRTAVLASTASLAALGVFAADTPGMLWPISVTTLLTQLGVITVLGLRGRTPPAIAAWTVPACTAILQIWSSPGRSGELDLANVSIITFLSNGAFVLAVSLLIAQRGRIRRQLLDERRAAEQEHERLILAEEKTRIARELHDVVAHGLSLIQVQASSAPYRIDGLVPEARDEFSQISAAARGAMSEMRRLLSVLRNDTERAEREPQPELSQLPALVGAARDAGASIEVSLTPDPIGALPPGVALNSYRIVQEALSNAMRHAAGAPVSVTLRREPDTLAITVRNQAPPPRPRGQQTSPEPAENAGSGYGLIGMAERARLLGGSFSTGARADGGFEVHAVLPLSPIEGAMP